MKEAHAIPYWSKLKTVQKIYLSYLLICIVPITILATALIISTHKTVLRENAARQMHNIEIVARAVDGEFQRLQRISQQLADTQWVKKRGSTASIYRNEFSFSDKRSICNDLRGYIAASDIIRTISVVFPNQGEVYSSAGVYTDEDFFHTFSLEKGQTPLDKSVVYDRMKLPENTGLVCGEQLGMSGNASEHLFFLTALEYAQPMRSFLLVELNHSAVRNKIDLMRSSDLLSVELFSQNRTLAAVSFQRADHFVSYSYRSACFPLSFKAVYEKPVLFGAQGTVFILPLVLISILLILNLAWFLTQITYRPLKRLVTSLSSKTDMVAPTQDEYHMIEESVCQLYEEHENVLQMANRYRATARINFLRRLLQGYFECGEAVEKMQEFHVNFSDDLLHIVFLVDEKKSVCACQFGIMSLEEAISTFDCPYEIVELSKLRTAVIVGLTNEQTKIFSPADLKNRIELSYQEHTETTPCITSGGMEQGIIGIGKSYYTASELCTVQSVGSGKIITPNKDCYYPTEWELQLINRVKAGQQAMAETILDEILSENQKRGLPAPQMRQLILTLAETYSKVINEFDAHSNRYNELYDTINSSTDFSALRAALYSINATFCTEKSTLGETKDTEVQIIAHVKEHLTDPQLSLKDLGDRFNLSVSAVSKLFKRVCGINFYDFLLSGRMELACEMLENRKLPLSTVARAVGYENEYSFKRAFSRFYGVSVMEYLKSRKK